MRIAQITAFGGFHFGNFTGHLFSYIQCSLVVEILVDCSQTANPQK